MPRIARVDIADYSYHIINRAVMRLRIFNSDKNYEQFEKILEDAVEKMGMSREIRCQEPFHATLQSCVRE